MTGKNHLTSATASLITVSSAVLYVESYISDDKISRILSPAAKAAKDFMMDNKKIPLIIFVLISLLFYYLGTLLPDIDSENSTLGRYIHIPIEHRTYTHTLWVVIPFVIVGVLWFRPLMWLAFGYIMHLFFDSFSQCGVCWLYPITRYVSYGSGAKCKQHHFIKLYRTGSASETVVTVLNALIAVGALVFDVYIGMITFNI